MSHCGCDFGGRCVFHEAQDAAQAATENNTARDGFRRDLQASLARIEPYIVHDVGCTANDLDPLDKTPCICGLAVTRKSLAAHAR